MSTDGSSETKQRGRQGSKSKGCCKEKRANRRREAPTTIQQRKHQRQRSHAHGGRERQEEEIRGRNGWPQREVGKIRGSKGAHVSSPDAVPTPIWTSVYGQKAGLS